MKKILIFGDSLVEKLEFENSFEFSYHVESYPGWLARDIKEMLEISLKEDYYDFIVLCFGINDLGHGLLPQEVVKSLILLHNLIHAAKIKIIAINLLNHDLFNELYGQAADDSVEFSAFFYDLEMGDLLEDGLHLSEQGKLHFAESLQIIIEN